MSKVSFRARVLDPGKSMPVFDAIELPDLADDVAVNRVVAQMPTGMEKEEELEHDLQEAILAQQACKSGLANGDNHVIPTPKVSRIPSLRYDHLYPPQPAPSKHQLIKVQAALTIEKEQPEYDLDSEDDDWLAAKAHIGALDFEQIMDILENACGENQICQPTEARTVLVNFDDQLIDDVYDYWLQKRKGAAHINVQSLIARVKTESRRDPSGAINPHVAFRRRAEKMQTRKNRKNDEDSYEKILKLSHDLRKAVTLFEMVKRREKSKLALLDLDVDIFDRRMQAGDFNGDLYNELLYRVGPEFQFPSKSVTGDRNKNKSQSRKRRLSRSNAPIDKDLVSRAWLKQNAEDWHRPASVFLPSSRPNAKSCKESPDGKFSFKRRRGCIYRAPLLPCSSSDPFSGPGLFHRTFLSSNIENGRLRCVGQTRRRVGRGGRVIFDRKTGADHDYLSSSNNLRNEVAFSARESTGASLNAGSICSNASLKNLYFRPHLSAEPPEPTDWSDCTISGDCNVSTLENGQSRHLFAAVVSDDGEVCHVPITVGISDHHNHSLNKRILTLDDSNATLIKHPSVAYSSCNAFAANSAVVTEELLKEMVSQAKNIPNNHNKSVKSDRSKPSPEGRRTHFSNQNKMVAVVAANQHGNSSDLAKHLGHYDNNNESSATKKMKHCLPGDYQAAPKDFPVAALSIVSGERKKAVVSPMTSQPAPVSVSPPETITKLTRAQDGTTNGNGSDLDLSRTQIARPVR